MKIPEFKDIDFSTNRISDNNDELFLCYGLPTKGV